MRCLIGYTGFVGKNIKQQLKFDKLYNSKNINKINKRKFNLTVCAGAPGSMFHANKYPKQDTKSISSLIKNLKKLNTDTFILISTIQIYKNLKNKNLENSNKKYSNTVYGKNRLKLEIFCKKNFKKCIVVRLPSLYGNFLKKNYIFDIMNPFPSFIDKKKYLKIKDILKKEKINVDKIYFKKTNLYYLKKNNYLSLKKKKLLSIFKENYFLSVFNFNNKSKYQFYFLDNLWKDIKILINNNINEINLTTYPISTKYIYKILLNSNMPKSYGKLYNADIKTLHAKFWKNKFYIHNKKQVIQDLKKFKQKYSNEISYF